MSWSDICGNCGDHRADCKCGNWSIVKTEKKIMKLAYFGTNTDQPGHYFWEVGDKQLSRSSLYFHDLPFNPESVADQPRAFAGTGLSKGEVKFFYIGGFSILFIEGSPADNRGGSKAVWWVEGYYKLTEVKEAILSNVPSKALIDKMETKFKIKW